MRLLRQLLIENLMLAAAGGVLGLGWPDLRVFLARETIGPLLHQFHADHQEAMTVDAEAFAPMSATTAIAATASALVTR